MAADNNRTPEHDELMASRRQMWGAFTRFSTWSIVAVCLILILMAIFLV